MQPSPLAKLTVDESMQGGQQCNQLTHPAVIPGTTQHDTTACTAVKCLTGRVQT